MRKNFGTKLDPQSAALLKNLRVDVRSVIKSAPPAPRMATEKVTSPALAKDYRRAARHKKATMIEARQAKTAAEVITSLPGDDETVHIIFSGRFALWQIVPAILDLSGCAANNLHIATLGFNQHNIGRLCELVDGGKIGTVRLLCSHYFANTSAGTYNFARDEFGKRKGMDLYHYRTHAKLLLFALKDGRRITVESSANMRSCRNIEQASIFCSAELYDFHREWIDGLFAPKG